VRYLALKHDSRAKASAFSTSQKSQAGPVTHRTARNAAYMLAAEIVGKAATFIYTLLAARELSQLDFGAFAFALSFATLIAVLPEWGFDVVVVQRSSSDPSRLPQLRSASLTWKTLIGIPVMTTAAVIASFSRPTPQARTTLFLFMLAALLDAYSNTNRSSAAALQRQGGMALALVTQRLITAVLAIAALLTGLGLIGLSVAFVSGSAAGLLGTLLVLRRIRVPLKLRSVTWQAMRELLAHAWLVGLGALALMALFRIDMVILEAMKGDEAVATYAAAYRLLETLTFFTWTISRAVLPVMSASTDHSRVRRGVERGIAAAAFIYLPFAAMSLLEASPLIRLIFGSTYADQSAPALRWLAFAPIFFAIAYYAVAALISQGRSVSMVVTATTAMAVNIALNLVLIPFLAGTGAAIATTFAYLVESIIAVTLARRIVGRIHIWRPLAAPTVAGVAMGVVLVVLRLPVAVEAVVAGSVFLLIWFLLVRRLAPEQIAVMASLLRRSR
jgi:O-antigen/teichoic acid export membrane protein